LRFATKSFEPQLATATLGGVKHAELLDENCAIARSSGIVGERWVWVILRQAFNGARRFEDYQRGIGLARNVLTDRLNSLVDRGVLERRPYAEHAARELNEYRLTDKGRALFPVYAALMQWGNEWTGLPAPPVDLLHKPCGQRVSARVVCSHCGEDIDGHDTEPVVGRGTAMYREARGKATTGEPRGDGSGTTRRS
jgi:DNA-binding HxlR family transcriptional regulator